MRQKIKTYPELLRLVVHGQNSRNFLADGFDLRQLGSGTAGHLSHAKLGSGKEKKGNGKHESAVTSSVRNSFKLRA